MIGSGTLIRQAREAAHLSVEALARWARLDEALIVAAEAGERRLSADDLDRCARVFGLRLEDLLAGAAGNAPMTLLLRSDDHDGLDLRSILTAEIDIALGEFQRVVRDIADVENALGERRPTLHVFERTRPARGVHPGDHRARLVRSVLKLGDDPIPSMTKLVEGLGVAVLWVDGEQVDQALDGACTRSPRPAILVNLLGEGQTHPWRARATLAHELCHLLFDMVGPSRQVLVSPGGRGLGPALDGMEQVARAFAACLLAPTRGVRKVVGALDPTSEEAIRAVGELYGVGRTLAVNRLQHVFGLTATQRSAMEWRAARPYSADFVADQPAMPIGLRGSALLSLLRRALEQQKITPARARRMLLLDATVPLPFGDLGDIATPPVAPAARIARQANEYLAEHRAGLIAGAPEAAADATWRVPVFVGGVGGKDSGGRGALVMNAHGAIVRDETTPPS